MNPFYDNFQRATFFVFVGIFSSGMISLFASEAMHVDKCVRIIPKATCKLSQYEIRIHNITEKGSPIIAIAQGDCVYSIGDGEYKRYAMREGTFTAKGFTDYFDRGIEIPAAQSIVCEIK